MLNDISKESKALILLEFTKNLLMHSGYGELAELKKIIREEEKDQKKTGTANKEFIKEIIREKEVKKQEISAEIGKELEVREIIPVRVRPSVLKIPEPKLPIGLQYLKPTPSPIEIGLGKLNPFIKDPVVRRIECNGPGERIVVMVPLEKYADIILNKEEIDEIIKTFERQSKIPVTEGIYRVVVGKLIFSAIVSDVIGSKFVINKMNYAPVFR
ncbi:MAG: hypothetical protein AABY15_09110 [Nanoarchaeota archaeon]